MHMHATGSDEDGSSGSDGGSDGLSGIGHRTGGGSGTSTSTSTNDGADGDRGRSDGRGGDGRSGSGTGKNNGGGPGGRWSKYHFGAIILEFVMCLHEQCLIEMEFTYKFSWID